MSGASSLRQNCYKRSFFWVNYKNAENNAETHKMEDEYAIIRQLEYEVLANDIQWNRKNVVV